MHFDFIQIGAHTGEKISYKIFASSRSVLIEPVPYLFKKLTHNFSHCWGKTFFENVAISDKMGTAKIYSIKPDCVQGKHEWVTQLGSLNRNHIPSHFSGVDSDDIEAIEIDTIRPVDLIEKYDITSISELSIDTEGHDDIIIKSFPFNLVLPSKIIFEHKYMQDYYGICKILREHGYIVKAIDEENSVANLT